MIKIILEGQDNEFTLNDFKIERDVLFNIDELIYEDTSYLYSFRSFNVDEGIMYLQFDLI